MKMAEAMQIIEKKPKGFRVHFEHAEDGILRGDYFPERGEKLIQTEIKAWRLANSFASKTKGRCVNIYVCDDLFCPVPGYKDKEIQNH